MKPLKNMDIYDVPQGLSFAQDLLKRGFDIVLSTVGLCLFGWLIAFAWLLASVETGSNGFFLQERVGRYGKYFKVIKIKTMAHSKEGGTTITTSADPRITRLGALFRKFKIDELPQLINVLIGDMSFVGPRPDVPGYADKLKGRNRIVLAVRPGITGPATLKYRNEEELLAKQTNAEAYNDNVIFPDKVAINRHYVENYSFAKDVLFIFQTLFK